MTAKKRTDRVVHIPPGKAGDSDTAHIDANHHIPHNQPLVHYGVSHPAVATDLAQMC